MCEILLDGVMKRYGTTVAVDHFSLAVADGEFVSLLGPSGCGKTTTLRMLAGFVAVTEGHIRLGARDVTALPPYRRNVGLVFQNYALFPHMTVAQNVAFGLEMRRLPRAEIALKVVEALARVRLADFAERLPRQISGGQQQRVALARALVIAPDVLLLDEPLSNLDARLRQELRAEIRELQRTLSLTTIFVTHDQEEALSMSDRVVVMNRGRIEQVGTPAEIYDAPHSRFVADFTGMTNFIQGRRCADGSFDIGGSCRLCVAAGGRADAGVLAIRPDRIWVGAAAPGRFDNELPGVLRAVTYLGTAYELSIALRAGPTLIVRQPAGPAAGALAVGQTVHVGWPADAGLLLDDDATNGRTDPA